MSTRAHGRVPGHALRTIDRDDSMSVVGPVLTGKRWVDWYPRCDCGWTECCASKEAARQAYTKHLSEVRERERQGSRR